MQRLLVPLALTLTAAAPLSAPEGAAEERPPGPRRVAIVVFEGVELLDFAGPAEVFTAAHQGHEHAFEVFTVSSSRAPIVSQGFLAITPDHAYADCPPADVVVVPGGGIPTGDRELRKFLRSRGRDAELVMSVCNGAILLAGAGLLDGLEVTTHHSALAQLQLVAPDATVFTNRRFVDSGGILTAAGVSAGIDGALHAVARLVGPDSARATARYMEYDWRPEEIAAQHAEPGERVQNEGFEQVEALVDAESVEEAAALHTAWSADDRAPSEAFLNRAGYGLKNAGRLAASQRLFELVVHLWPDSANACDSLAELHEDVGQNDEAEHWARRTLELVDTAPEALRPMLRRTAEDRLQRLRGLATTGGFRCPPCNCDYDGRTFPEPGRCPDAGCSMELVAAPAGSRGAESASDSAVETAQGD